MGDLRRFRIFGPCYKTSRTFWRLRWGVKQLKQEKSCIRRCKTSKKMMFLASTCRSKRNRIILCCARKAWWSWAEISSILSSLSYWKCSKSCDEIAPTSGSHLRSEGWRENQLSYLMKKKFLPLIYIIFFSYHPYGWIIIYLLLYMIFVKIFVKAWKCKNGKPQVQLRREWQFQPIINNAKL